MVLQEATGDVPSQRDTFCIVGVSGGATLLMVLGPCEIPFTQTLIIAFSYPEIFIYGGRVDVNYGGSPATQTINAGLDKVYILCLPSFLWFKANYTSPDPRTDHTCSIVGNRQMLSIGGLSITAASFSKY